jgi:hypothetical protein
VSNFCIAIVDGAGVPSSPEEIDAIEQRAIEFLLEALDSETPVWF